MTAIDIEKQLVRKADTVFLFDPRVHMNLSKADRANLDQLDKYEEYQWMVDVSKLRTGASFGELALINNESRKATITCVTDCNFAVLEKSDYNKVLRKIQLKEDS